jgi:hypothetical protein
VIQRLLLILLLACSLASAATIVANVDWSRGENIWIDENGKPIQTYFSGVLLITLTDNGVDYNRDTLCADLFTDIVVHTPYSVTLLHPDQVPGRNLEQASWLVDNALLPTNDPTITATAFSSDQWVRTAPQGAGIQLAIWDIVEDGGDGLYAGAVQVSSDPLHATEPNAVYWAELYEAASIGQSSDLSYIYDPRSLGYPTPLGTRAQMLIGPRFQDDGPHPNPEPATFAVAGAAVLAGLIIRRRR